MNTSHCAIKQMLQFAATTVQSLSAAVTSLVNTVKPVASKYKQQTRMSRQHVTAFSAQ